MPCCLAIILALVIPRIFIACLYFFTHWFQGVFASTIWPILGFLFLPITLLWYSAVQNWYDGHWGVLQIAILVIAVAIDISPSGGHKHARRKAVPAEE